MALSSLSSASMEWEEARAEFFQETYPSDRSVSDSIGALTTNTSASNTGRRTVIESVGTGSRNGHPASMLGHPTGAHIINKDNTAAGTLESRTSRVSRHSSNVHVPNNRTPPTASTTPADAISPSGDSVRTSTDDQLNAIFSSRQGTNDTRRGGRMTKARMRAAVQGLEEEDSEGEIEVVDFTDENLATEVESWRNCRKLREMPIPLSQKKAMRSQYEKCPKIKLNRCVALGFACSRFHYGVASLMGKICRNMTDLSRPLLGIDRHRGSEMFAALSLHKIMIFISAIVGLTVLSFLVLPYLVFTCDFSLEMCDDVSTTNSTQSTAAWLNAIFGQEAELAERKILKIPFYYGFFEAKNSHVRYANDSPVLQQVYTSHFPAIYLCVVVVCQLGIGIYLFHQLIQLIKGVISDYTADTWFKNVFSSWNYNVVCKTSSMLKHRSVYRHVKQKIQQTKSLSKPKTCCTRCLIVAARFLSFFLTLVIWASIVLAVHFATLLQFQQPKRRHLLAGMDASWQAPLGVVIYILPVASVILTKLLILPLAGLLEKWECYPFTLRVTVYSTRLFVSRAVAMLTLVTTIYHIRISRTAVSNCWEDHLCTQTLALTICDLAADCLLIVFIRFPRVLLTSMCKRQWSCTTKLNYDPYETVVDLVLDLGLMCVGLFYCPSLPFVVCAKLCLGYGLKMFHIWVNCSASRDIHSPSCIRFLFVGFSSVIVLFSGVVLAFALTYNPVSSKCGPFADVQYVVDTLTKELAALTGGSSASTSNATSTVLNAGGLSSAAITAYILASLIFVLVFGLYISHLKRLSIERNANELKCQLAIATQEKCYLISKIKRPARSEAARRSH